jgi:hypothetical protein
VAALDTDKFAFFFRNRCTQDGIYGNAAVPTADVDDGGTLVNIYHKSLLRTAQLAGNDATVDIELRDKWRDVQAIHIVADLTPEAVITISSKSLPSDSYTVRKTLDLGTEDASFIPVLYESPEERRDPPFPVYSSYLTTSEQATVLGHPFWRIRLFDNGQAPSGSLFLRKVYLGPIFQFLTVPMDGYAEGFSMALTQAGVGNRVYGVPHSNPAPVLREITLNSTAKTESDLADFYFDLSRVGLQRPFFFAHLPSQGTITDATNYHEKWHVLYGLFRAPVIMENVPKSGGLVRYTATVLESR